MDSPDSENAKEYSTSLTFFHKCDFVHFNLTIPLQLYFDKIVLNVGNDTEKKNRYHCIH